jgi:outer membrane biosynthesis protein TonB
MEPGQEEPPPVPEEETTDEHIHVDSLEELESAMDRVIDGEADSEPAEEPAVPQQPVRKAVRKKQPTPADESKEDASSGSVQTASRTATATSEGEEGWYYFQDGQRIGPMSREDIEDLAADGRLDPDDKVWLPTSTRWARAREVAGLAEVL